MKKLIGLFLIIGAFGCSSVKVAFDYDKQVDFAKYKTYQLVESELETSVGQLNADRIVSSFDEQMTLEGLTKSASPDMLVDIHVKSKQKMTATATTTGTGGYGYGRYGRWGGYGYGGMSTTNVSYDEYTEGTMFITFVDSAEKKIIWQGTGTKTLTEGASASKREKNIDYAIQQILENYPPVEK